MFTCVKCSFRLLVLIHASLSAYYYVHFVLLNMVAWLPYILQN